MFRKILMITGLVWSLSVFSQRVLNGYMAPQTVVHGSSIRMLPGFHANSNDGSYNGNPTKFIAKIGNPQTETIPPSTTISNTNASSGENYVYTRSYLVPVTESNANAPQIQSISYFDGLGRPKQNIAIKSTPGGNDLVTPIVYDAFGRQTLDYLPVSTQGTSNGTIYRQTLSTTPNSPVPFPVADAIGIYKNERIFSEKKLENSPLDRVKEQFGTGDDWKTQNKRVVFDYQANEDNDKVIRFVAQNATPVWTDGITKSILSVASPNNYYPKATLYKNKVTDEDNNVSYEFKNGQGQTLLVRKMLTSTQSADTYYVYNEYDQLAFVISPLAADKIKPQPASANLSETGEILAELSYQYRYDGRNRLAEKKLPGKGLIPNTSNWRWELMIYDQQDRLIMTQDANLKNNEQWLFTKYDQFGRVAYTGITTDPRSRGDIQSALNLKNIKNNVARTTSSGFSFPGLVVYYDNLAANNYPNTIDKLLSVNYYDTYPNDKPNVSDLGFTQSFITDNAQSNNISTKSLPVASYLNNIEVNSWTKTFSYYDDKARVIASYTKNYLGGYTKTESVLDFSGVPQKTIIKHKRRDADTEVVINERFIYDHQNRLKKHYHQVNNNAEVLLAENTYDELGRLNNKKVGDNLQSIDYDYNVRGWMTGINLIKTDPLKPLDINKAFAYKIKYTNPDNPSMGAARYNGNIAEVDWTYGSNNRKRYGYIYDNLNRLTKANYQEFNLTTSSTPSYYNEEVDYDLNGNITFLNRFAAPLAGGSRATQVDKLKYYYENGNLSNRLWKITDNEGEVANSLGYPGGGGTITYDDNGNMKTMPDKGIIQPMLYNHLNLPKQIGKSNSQLYYNYLADGTKISKSLNINGDFSNEVVNTDYLDGFVYTTAYSYSLAESLNSDDPSIKAISLAGQEEALELDDKDIASTEKFGTAVLEFFPTTEGFYDYKNSKYIYQYKDHLGNVRLSYSRDTSTGAFKSEESNSYYPFGMNHIGARARGDGDSSFSPSTTYKNYKYNGKELQETGMYDYGARFYMPDIGRWGTVDRLSEFATNWSPYRYAYDNPIKYYDPTGMLEQGGEDPNKIYKGATIEEVVIVNVRPLPKMKPMEPNFGSTLQDLRNEPHIFLPGAGNGMSAIGKGMINLTLDVGNALRNFIGFGRDKTGPAGERWTNLDGTPMGGQEQQTQVVNMLVTLFGGMYGLAAETSAVPKFSGTEKAWQSGATPNSIYTYLSADGETAVSNYIYNAEGKVSFQVDFQNHGIDWLSGHGHNMSIPGKLGSGHLPENHILHNLVPSDYKLIPPNTRYSVPLAK